MAITYPTSESFPQPALDVEGVGLRYDLSDDEMQEVTTRELAEIGAPEGKLVGVVVTPDSPLFNVANTLERRIFEEHFEGNDEAYMRENYEPYLADSRFFMVAERAEGRARPIAFMRIIQPSEDVESTKSIDDAAENIGMSTQEIRDFHKMDDLRETWDVATLGLIREYQDTLKGVQARILLNRMCILLATNERIEHMVAIMDKGALKGLLAVGIPVKPMGSEDTTFDKDKAFEFDGSGESYAVYGSIPDFWGAVAKRYGELKGAKRFTLDLLHGGLKYAVKRQLYAQTAGRLLTGRAVDQYLHLPQGI